ncbi:hypothetical protein JCM3774_005068 [Rhodotorula dairenensis]
MASDYLPNMAARGLSSSSDAAYWDRRTSPMLASGPFPPRRYQPPSETLRPDAAREEMWGYYKPDSVDEREVDHGQHGDSDRGAYRPRPSAAEPSIKCSSCSELVELEQLGDHVCQAAGRNLRSLRVDVSMEKRHDDWPAPKSATLRVTNPDEHDHGTSGSDNYRSDRRPTAAANPRSPGSPAPNSATSTARLPFFERYQKLVDTSGSNNEAAAAAGQVGSAIPRSPQLALANLAPPFERGGQGLAAPQHQASMSTSRSEPLLLSPPTPTYPVRKNSLPSPRSPQLPPNHARSGHEPDDEHRDHARQTSRSKKPTRRECVESTYLAYASFGNDEDGDQLPYSQAPTQSETLSSSWSSPANLAGLTVPSPHARLDGFAREEPALPASPSGLDACLADLQLLAEGDGVDEGAAGLMIRGFGGSDDHDKQASLTRKRGQQQRQHSSRSPTSRSRSIPPCQDNSDHRRPAPSPAATCGVCRAPLDASAASNGLQRSADDGQALCRACYADLYLPKCRKCHTPIEGGAVTSSDGKIAGKYHTQCFGCIECSASFPDGEFYVFDGKPYCQLDYHALNGSLCAARGCGQPIEGSCVSLMGEENGGGGRYHPTCFCCCEPSCRRPLLDYHYIVQRLPFCEEHSAGMQTDRSPRAARTPRSQLERIQKRQTIITRR